MRWKRFAVALLASCFSITCFADTYVYCPAPNYVVQGTPWTNPQGITLQQAWLPDMIPGFIDLTTLGISSTPVNGSTYNPTTQQFVAPTTTNPVTGSSLASNAIINSDGTINTTNFNPLMSIAAGGSVGHIAGNHATGSPDDVVPAMAGDATGTNAATTVALQKPGYCAPITITSGATIQLPSTNGSMACSEYPLIGGTLLSSATIKLPANPTDRQLARVYIQAGSALTVTALSFTDANATVIAASTGLGLLSSSSSYLFQYQGTAWQRIGS